MEVEVWNKAVEDTAGLREYFNNNRDKYQWEERLETIVLDAENETILQTASQEYEEGIFKVESLESDDIALKFSETHWGDSITNQTDAVLKALQQDTTLCISIDCGYVKKEKKTLATTRLEKLKAYLFAKGVDSTRILSYNISKQKYLQDASLGGHMVINYYSKNPSVLSDKFNKANPLALQIKQLVFEKGDEAIPAAIQWRKGNYTYEADDRFYKAYVENIIPAGPKALEENRGQVISDYQNFLEKQWLNMLKSKYEIEVNNSLLEKIAEEKN
ncbi:MAG: hypothetical protein AAGI07_19425 [Bacteroidota bacterium]